jgi:hypothetical protein
MRLQVRDGVLIASRTSGLAPGCQIERYLNRNFDLAYKVFERMLEQRTRPAVAIAAE